ncbi:MAG: YbjN domain-containing protein [Congregibacter sp.]
MVDELEKPNRSLLRQWLRESKVQFSDCGECEGLHITSLQGIEGVVDSRLFLEPYGLLLTSELEVRPMALLAISADLGRINMDYPLLKAFLDVVDDATPQLVMAGVLPTQARLSLGQFANFVSNTMDATRQLGGECLRLDYLFAEGETTMPKGRALH